MYAAFTPKLAHFLLAVSLGVQGAFYEEDEDYVQEDVGTERTFSEHPHLIHDRDKVLAILKELTVSLAEDLVKRDCMQTTLESNGRPLILR